MSRNNTNTNHYFVSNPHMTLSRVLDLQNKLPYRGVLFISLTLPCKFQCSPFAPIVNEVGKQPSQQPDKSKPNQKSSFVQGHQVSAAAYLLNSTQRPTATDKHSIYNTVRRQWSGGEPFGCLLAGCSVTFSYFCPLRRNLVNKQQGILHVLLLECRWSCGERALDHSRSA